MKKIAFKSIEPKILYFGTPVALITTVDNDGNANIGPMSSVWALGWTFMLGLEEGSKTYQNLMEQKECVCEFSIIVLVPACRKNSCGVGITRYPIIKKTVMNMMQISLRLADLPVSNRNW